MVKSSTKESQANYVYIMPDYDNPKMGHPVFLEITPAPEIKYKVVPGSSKQMNVLGIVIFSATMGKEGTVTAAFGAHYGHPGINLKNTDKHTRVSTES